MAEKPNRKGWQRFSLRGRIYSILAALLVITFFGGGVMIWYTYRMERLLADIVDRDLNAFQAAADLEAALINQKGFVSYYFLEGDPGWLRQLGEFRQIFKSRLAGMRSMTATPEEDNFIDQIENNYLKYVEAKDRIITRFQNGDREASVTSNAEIRDHFSSILRSCEEYKCLQRENIGQARRASFAEARELRFTAVFAMIFFVALTSFLMFVLSRQILGPIRKLALVTDHDRMNLVAGNEVFALQRQVYHMIENIDNTQVELEKSREHLLQSEKMAMVGKLAAGMAHSIRNPLTSVKMRLFSLNRNLDLTPVQREDFDVISDEIRHIDAIVENFLEFSRPPRLKIQVISPSEVVDMVVQLLEHRLHSYGVHVNILRQAPLPVIEADPEQLKEVLANLIINACEAMEHGGSIAIQEEEAFVPPLNKVAVIRLTDTGPGIPESLQEKVFHPFFTTKDEGTGLGLSIAARIIEEHKGWLDVASREGEGASFVITLPVKE